MGQTFELCGAWAYAAAEDKPVASSAGGLARLMTSHNMKATSPKVAG